MGKRIFGTICFILALLFTLAAIRGLLGDNFSVVFVVPAMAAIVLIFLGVRDYKSSS